MRNALIYHVDFLVHIGDDALPMGRCTYEAQFLRYVVGPRYWIQLWNSFLANMVPRWPQICGRSRDRQGSSLAFLHNPEMAHSEEDLKSDGTSYNWFWLCC